MLKFRLLSNALTNTPTIIAINKIRFSRCQRAGNLSGQVKVRRPVLALR